MYRKYWIIKAGEEMRIDAFAFLHGVSKRMLKDIKMKGDILVDGVHQTVRYCLNEGETLLLIYPPETNHILKVNLPLSIVYEDDYLLVIDKAKGMPCIPTLSHQYDTLANALSYYYERIGLDSTVHLVNRLDKDTAGLMIVAKYREIHDYMCKDISHIYRKYHAHVKGQTSSGSICLPIYKNGTEMKRVIDDRGQRACTYYRTLEYQDGVSLVECVLLTGRTHQIRIHMSAIGHPLIGDQIYGDGVGEFDLKSVMVAFEHPVTKQIKVIRKGNFK